MIVKKRTKLLYIALIYNRSEKGFKVIGVFDLTFIYLHDCVFSFQVLLLQLILRYLLNIPII